MYEASRCSNVAMRVALLACAWLLLACKEACPRQHPCDQTYEAPALANPLLQIAASSQRLDARLQDATTAALRLRAALAKLDDVHARAWVEELDVKIQRLAGAWCGSVVNAQGKAVEVMSTPVDLLFPVDKVDAADRAYCGGLSVRGAFVPGPAWNGRPRGDGEPTPTFPPDLERDGQLHFETADDRLGDAILDSLRERALLVAGSRPRAVVLLPALDLRIQRLVAALCGNPIEFEGRRIDVLSTPPARFYPLDAVGHASTAQCTGLVVDRQLVRSPLFTQAPAP